MTRVLLTGANGLLGSACVGQLAQGADVDLLAVWHRSRTRIPAATARLTDERCDVTDAAAVDALFQRFKPEIVIHAAAALADPEPDYLVRALRSNVMATANVVEAAARVKSRRIVYCSSTSIYGGPCPADGWSEEGRPTPTSVYGWSKLAGEDYARFACANVGVSAVALRLSGVHGAGRESGVVFNTIRAARANEPIRLANADVPFQLLFIDDAVSAVIGAARREGLEGFHAINVASHVFPTLRALAADVVAACDSRSIIEHAGGQSQPRHVMNVAGMAALGVKPGDAATQLRQTVTWYDARA